MQIYLLRHGTTEWNSEHRIQGHTDIPLDSIGLKMAEETGKALHDMGIAFDLVYSSPLSRATETARLVSRSESIMTDNDLMELSFGNFEGKLTTSMTDDPVSFFRYFKTDPVRYNEHIIKLGASDYESLDHLCERADHFLKEKMEPIVKDGSISKVLISGHGAINRALMLMMGRSRDLSSFWGSGLQPNCGIDVISCSYDSGIVIYDISQKSNIYYSSELMDSVIPLL